MMGFRPKIDNPKQVLSSFIISHVQGSIEASTPLLIVFIAHQFLPYFLNAEVSSVWGHALFCVPKNTRSHGVWCFAYIEIKVVYYLRHMRKDVFYFFNFHYDLKYFKSLDSVSKSVKKSPQSYYLILKIVFRWRFPALNPRPWLCHKPKFRFSGIFFLIFIMQKYYPILIHFNEIIIFHNNIIFLYLSVVTWCVTKTHAHFTSADATSCDIPLTWTRRMPLTYCLILWIFRFVINKRLSYILKQNYFLFFLVFWGKKNKINI